MSMQKLHFFTFQMYDADRSGCISKEELASMLRVRTRWKAKPAELRHPLVKNIFSQKR
jgi:Ca2+-binding EF-hand superfamily protein